MRHRPKTAHPRSGLAVGVLFAALALPSAPASAAQSGDGRLNTPPALRGLAWLRVSYAELLDESAFIRTGQPLPAAVRDPAVRGAVQPFVAPYSYLLQHAVEILNGPDPLPHTSVTDHYPPGGPEPAWVAVFRVDRVHAVADGKDHVRLFLEGEDPDAAYAQHYSVVRHCLNALLPPEGKPLHVQVYAYQHDYAASELKLNTRCSRLAAASFPSRKKELDHAALSKFFAQGKVLEGAQLSREEGLVLYGRPGKPPSLGGQPLSLADLAVAYRAVFHAGDNAAFVSLDQHPDPTKVTVNFGGCLEDTRIGSVVLEGDKRFKTITSGIDPGDGRDLRQSTRQRIPSFMSVAERDLVGDDSAAAGGWIATRFWFYPDKAGVETDPNHTFAAITHPQFAADAERSRTRLGLGTEPEPETPALSAGVRQAIDHLNKHYAEYAEAFPELGELSTVARLMAIAAWLKQANPDWLDLDSLLAVELPACKTERERVRLLAATVLTSPAQERGKPASPAAGATLLHLTPVLERSLRDYFETPDQLAAYLRLRRASPPDARADCEAQAADLLAKQGAAKVNSLVQSRRDLMALVEYAVTAQRPEPSSTRPAVSTEIESSEKDLDRLRAEIAAVKRQLGSASGPAYNRLVQKHNSLVKQYNEALRRQRERVAGANAAPLKMTAVMDIAGGIDLDPRSFEILTAADSERLAELQRLARSLRDRGLLTARASDWIRSQAARIPIPPEIAALPTVDWRVTLGKGAEGAALAYARSAAGDKAWGTMLNPDGSWQAGLQETAAQYCESSLQPRQGKFDLRKLVSGKVVEHLIGGIPAAGLIVFKRGKVRDVLEPLAKPFKWLGKLF